MFIIESKMADNTNKDAKGQLSTSETDPENLFDEIQKLMYDCPLLTLVSIKIIPDDIKEFINSKATRLKLGDTRDRNGSICNFTLVKKGA